MSHMRQQVHAKQECTCVCVCTCSHYECLSAEKQTVCELLAGFHISRWLDFIKPP